MERTRDESTPRRNDYLMIHGGEHARRCRAAREGRAGGRAAFTLAELVVVMAMIGILAAIAAPRYASSLSKFRIEAATQRIIGDLRAARRQANITSTSTVFTLDAANSTYTITGMSRFDRRGGIYTVNLGAEPYYATVTSFDLGGGKTITYDPYGQITGGGTITLAVGAFTNLLALDATNGESTVKPVSAGGGGK